MSDDLISRKALMEKAKNYFISPEGALRLIESQPTAYDLDKIVERLQAELNLADKEKERFVRENPLQFDTAKGYAQGISVALEIIKSEGVLYGGSI